MTCVVHNYSVGALQVFFPTNVGMNFERFFQKENSRQSFVADSLRIVIVFCLGSRLITY
jgi:hypothetical protein